MSDQFIIGCLDCSQACATCAKIPGFCTSCKNDQFLSGSTCTRTPSLVFTLSDQLIIGCLECSKGCATCDKAPNNCTSCEDDQFLFGTSCKRTLSLVFVLSDQLIIGYLECSPTCATCSGTSDNCHSCATRLGGQCVDKCPNGFFKDNDGNCTPCFADCAACSGGAFNQCTDCRPDRPVLDKKENRCYMTCKNKNEYFDQSKLSCQPCDPSCSSCYGSGPNNCLACSDSSKFLQINGSCSPPPPNHFGYLSANWSFSPVFGS